MKLLEVFILTDTENNLFNLEYHIRFLGYGFGTFGPCRSKDFEEINLTLYRRGVARYPAKFMRESRF